MKTVELLSNQSLKVTLSLSLYSFSHKSLSRYQKVLLQQVAHVVRINQILLLGLTLICCADKPEIELF